MRLFEMFMHTNIQLLCDLQTHTGGLRGFETHCFSSNTGHTKRTSAICHKIAFLAHTSFYEGGSDQNRTDSRSRQPKAKASIGHDH